MSRKFRSLQISDINMLNSAISESFPTLDVEEVESVRSRIVQYISNGLVNGYDIGLVTTLDDNEINLKILRLFEEDADDD